MPARNRLSDEAAGQIRDPGHFEAERFIDRHRESVTPRPDYQLWRTCVSDARRRFGTLNIKIEIVDWTDCDLVERVPGKVVGRPVIKGTRIEPETVLMDHELGAPIEEIHESFPSLSFDSIRKLLAYAKQPVP